MKNKKIFNKKDTDLPFYNSMMKKPEYFNKIKKRKFKFIKLSPAEYMNECCKIHKSELFLEESMISEEWVKKYLNDMKNGDKFPIPILDYADGVQEGRHRVECAKRLNIKKIPVMIIEEVKP